MARRVELRGAVLHLALFERLLEPQGLLREGDDVRNGWRSGLRLGLRDLARPRLLLEPVVIKVNGVATLELLEEALDMIHTARTGREPKSSDARTDPSVENNEGFPPSCGLDSRSVGLSLSSTTLASEFRCVHNVTERSFSI